MWPIQNLRLVWFSTDITKSDAERLFTSLFTQEPDHLTISKQPTAQSPTLETAGGSVDIWNVEVQRQIGRLDLIVQPVTSLVHGDDPQLPLLDAKATFEMALNALQAATWVPTSQRLSVVASAICAADSLDDARRKFYNYLGYDFNINGASDHSFQMNRRSMLVEDEVNRVDQLSVLQMQKLQISVGQEGVPQRVLASSESLSVLHDFNTVPTAENFPANVQLGVFCDLLNEVTRAMKIANLGFLRD